MSSLAERLTTLRLSKNASKKQVAEAVGVHPSSIGNLEKGSIPQADLLLLLSKYFNVTMEYLMLGDEIESNQPRINDDELRLLNLFQKLTQKDKEDVIEFIDYKLSKYKKGLSSSLINQDNSKMA